MAMKSIRWMLLIVGFFGCAPTDPVDRQNAATDLDDVDRRTLRLYWLSALTSDAVDRLVQQELPYRLLESTAQNTIVELQATDAMVRDLEASGLFLRTEERRAHIRKPLSQPCFDIPNPQTSDYLWGYETIREYAYALQHGDRTGMILTSDIGLTQTSSHAIVAIRFGPPTASVQNPPTIYLVATQHAREWGAAGTAVGLMRELANTIANPTYRPQLRHALETTAVVVVPVANPDGYEHSRTANRGQRGNRDTTACSYGVDINRNHSATWAVAAGFISFVCAEGYIGPGPASESETRALDNLLQGGIFVTNQPVLALDYHTFSDLVVYPLAFKQTTDSDGPRCNGNPDRCTVADHQALRRLLGDTEQNSASQQLFVDDGVMPAEPFRRDQAPNILYTSSGTLIDQAVYGPEPMLSATIELFGTAVDFGIECEDKREDLLRAAVSRQLDVVERLATVAPGLADGAAVSWLPSEIGQLASGTIHREYADGQVSAKARPEFVKPAWLPASKGRNIKTWVGTTQVPMLRTRKGAQYELFSVSAEKLTGDPLRLPCEIRSDLENTDKYTLDVVPECLPGSEVNLCDARRLQTSDWEIQEADRGGTRDCWWEPRSSQAVMLVGGVQRALGRIALHFLIQLPARHVACALSTSICRRARAQQWRVRSSLGRRRGPASNNRVRTNAQPHHALL